MGSLAKLFRALTAVMTAILALTQGAPSMPVPEPARENAALSAISADILPLRFDHEALYTLDLAAYLDARPGVSASDYYDTALMMGVLQGLVNRDAPRLYIFFTSANNADRVWFERLTSSTYWREKLGREPQFLAGKEIVALQSPADALYVFRDFFKGFAVWDNEVPATSNAALTACGCDNLLPLRYSAKVDSLYANLTGLGVKDIFNYKDRFTAKRVAVDLHGRFRQDAEFVFGTSGKYRSTGSRKCDAALWAVRNYLETGKTNPHLMAYHIDAYYPRKTANGETAYDMGHIKSTAFLLNNDYYIAKKAFFFDLCVMKNEIPSDDPDQAGKGVCPLTGSADYRTLQVVLAAQNALAAKFEYAPITCGGFTAWHIKYTNFIQAEGAEKLSGPVAVEWQTVREFSYYNVMLDADAPGLVAMSDASVFMHYPHPERYEQKSAAARGEATADEGGNFNYVMVYMGDYDSAAWLNSQSLTCWDNAQRGTVPLAWSFAPGLYERAPHVIDYLYATATPNDTFVCGDNGAGYLNPEALAVSKHFGTLEQWAAYNKTLFERFDMDIQGFLIFDKGVKTPGDFLLRRRVLDAYASFAPAGLLTNNASGIGPCTPMPVVKMADALSAEDLLGHLRENPAKNGSAFTAVRVILQSPETVNRWARAIEALPGDYRLKIVDPYTFMALYARSH
ncbi:MAG: hypothetical protein BWY37_02083 [Firmicutes bacterium ADurb.Bin262]|nr:MAG: hypothetical protein BWY37_02083 [Firmicutes bacterium ADurb.Bin262]